MKNIKLMLMAAGVALLSTSCLVDDEDKTLDDMSNTPYAIGFINTAPAISYFEDLGTVDEQVIIDVIGGQDGGAAESNLTVQYEVNSESTAQEGVEFNFASTKGTVVIPEGEKFGTIDLDVITGNFNPDEATTLILDITSVPENSAIVAKQSQIVISFVGCLSNLGDFDYMVTTVNTGSGSNQQNDIESLTTIDVNTFRTESTGPYGAAAGSIVPPASYNGFNFTDVCGVITIPEQSLGGYYSNLVYGEGTVDPQTGNIQVTYTIEFASGNNVYSSTFIRQ